MRANVGGLERAKIFIKAREGLYLQAYQKGKDVPTIGYGYIKGVYMGMSITQQQADKFFDEDFQEALNAVERLIDVELSDDQLGALVSFTFNVGQSALAKSELRKRLNNHEDPMTVI